MTSSDTSVPVVELNSGGRIPQLGFGTWQIAPEEAEQAVAKALEVGYRHVDTAQMYGNEVEVGTAIKASGLDRGEIFLTTKLSNEEHGFQKAKNALEESLSKLATEYVDLFLIHWPKPQEDRYVETWRALVELRSEGKVREIGVSNFTVANLQRLADETEVVPAVNQIELHPFFQQHGLKREHGDRGIVTEAWSPLAQGGELLEEDAVAGIADAHGKKPGHVVLRWHIQNGNVIFPKSVTPDRIAQNFEIFDFELSADEIATIDGLDRGERIGPDPDQFG